MTSYSVTEGFPNPYLAREAGLWSEASDDEDGEAEEFYDLRDDQKWEICLEALKKLDDGRELSPVDWEMFRFCDYNAFTLLEQARYHPEGAKS